MFWCTKNMALVVFFFAFFPTERLIVSICTVKFYVHAKAIRNNLFSVFYSSVRITINMSEGARKDILESYEKNLGHFCVCFQVFSRRFMVVTVQIAASHLHSFLFSQQIRKITQTRKLDTTK